jgi:hypothetical protein
MKTEHEAFAFWFAGVLGLCGLHRLYVGKTVTGLLWLLTFGFLGIGQLVDLMWLGDWVESANSLRLGLDLPIAAVPAAPDVAVEVTADDAAGHSRRASRPAA